MSRSASLLSTLLAYGLFFLCLAPPLAAQVQGQTPLEEEMPEEERLKLWEEHMKKWGPNDTIYLPAIWYRNEVVNYKEMEMAWVSRMPPKELARYIEEWTRLRNAVYLTYPYARIAGATINEINALLEGKSRLERKAIIKSREKDLKQQFADPISNLSVYQGKILMKLINRQTGNNCYDIIKEYKGGFNARFYQTVAFFVGGNLKQRWDLHDKDDRQIENIVKEIDGSWYGNPHRY